MIKIKTFLLATLLLTGLVFPATAQIGEPRTALPSLLLLSKTALWELPED